MRNQILFLSIVAFILFSCSKSSLEPVTKLPDLTITRVSYSIPPGPLAGIIEDTIYVQNIGQGDFNGLLYVAQESEKDYRRIGLFGEWALLYCEWDSNAFKPAQINAGQTVRLMWGSVVPSDTNVIRFHIATDTVGRKETIMALPTYQETDYSNNDYLLTINK